MLYEIDLDVEKDPGRFSTGAREITVRQGDALSYVLDVSLRQGGEVFDLRGCTVRLYAEKPDGTVVVDGENVSVLDAKGGKVRYTVPSQLVSACGRVPCYLRITEAANQSEWSASTEEVVLVVVRGVGVRLASSDYVPEIDGLLADMDKQLSDFSQAEEARASGETARETAEQDRAEAERLRREAETARLSNESSRTSAEDSRAAAESSRVTAEQARASAETARAAEFAVFEAKAQEWVPRILVEGEYDPMTRKPTLAAGEFCTVYMSPSADSADMNAYDEYMYVPDDSEAGGHFEKLGASSVDFPAATVADVAGILDGTVTQGGAGITVTAMAALKTGFDDAYAAAEHSHAIADVTGLRGELDDLDAAIGKLPVMADVNAKAGTGSGDEKVDSADVKGSPGENGYLDVYAEKGDDALMLRAWDAGKVEMVRFDGDGYGSDWELNAHHLLSDVRGSATDLSYAALRELPPGCYLVPSTAANQPTSGQGDGNLMVGRVSDNRVWAVVAYNTGACYMSYGYETGGSAANFKWARVDSNSPDQVHANVGICQDMSYSALRAARPGLYLIYNGTTANSPVAAHGNLLVVGNPADRCWAVAAYDNGSVFALRGFSGNSEWVRIDNSNVSAAAITGTLSADHGGTGTSNGALATIKGNPIGTLANDTVAKWMEVPSGVYWFSTAGLLHGQPSQYGYLMHVAGKGSNCMNQFFLPAGSLSFYYRGANGATNSNGAMSSFVPAVNTGYAAAANGDPIHWMRTGSIGICSCVAVPVSVAANSKAQVKVSFPITFKTAPQILLGHSGDSDAYTYGWTTMTVASRYTTYCNINFYNGDSSSRDFCARVLAIGVV